MAKDDKSALTIASDQTIAKIGLRLGAHLTLTVPRSDITLFSSYETTIDHDNFLISAPMRNSIVYPLNPGDSVVIHFATANAFFEADAVVSERLRKGELQFLKMSSPSSVRRNQRRNDFRVDLILNTEVIETPEDDLTGAAREVRRYKAVINNLSGGGAALYSSVDVVPGGFLQVVLPQEIMGSERIITAQVHWVRKPERESPFTHYIGVRFLFEKEGDREDLIKFAFITQRKQMKRI